MERVFVVRAEVRVRAPIERCFLLSTSIEIVALELGMRPARGVVSGLVGGGDTVRWEGWQLGLPQFHESLINPFEPPVFFRDRMIDGRFASFEHDHRFIDQGDGTVLLRDEVRFSMPFGWAGGVFGERVMKPHIHGLTRRRFARLKQLAEGDGWLRYLSQS